VENALLFIKEANELSQSKENRKNLEQKFIFQIDTLNPHGINVRFSFD